MRKRIAISIVIALVFVFAFSGYINNENIEVKGDTYKYKAEEAGVVDTGINGEVTWTVYDDGRLVFKPTNGESGMFDNIDKEQSPIGEWHDYNEQVTSIKLEPGLKSNEMFNGVFKSFENVTEIDLGNIDTSKTKYFSSLFLWMKKLEKLELGNNFSTSSALTINHMFYGMEKLKKLDLGDKFDTSKVQVMHAMFSFMYSLEELNLGNHFDTSEVISFGHFLAGTPKLKELNLGDKFNTENVGKYGSGDMEFFFALEYYGQYEDSIYHDPTNRISNIQRLYVPENFKFIGLDESGEGARAYLAKPHGEEYTGKWIKEDGTAGPYTVRQIENNQPDFNGWWVWDTKEIELSEEFWFEGGYNTLPEQLTVKLIKDGEETDEEIVINKSDIDSETGKINISFGKHAKYSDEEYTDKIEYSYKLITDIKDFNKITETHYKYVGTESDENNSNTDENNNETDEDADNSNENSDINSSDNNMKPNNTNETDNKPGKLPYAGTSVNALISIGLIAVVLFGVKGLKNSRKVSGLTRVNNKNLRK